MFREVDVVSAFSSSTTQDVSNRVQKWNVGPERRKGLGTRRAYVWGNARHFCDCELNYPGCEQSRSEMERWKILHSAKDLGVGIAKNVERYLYRTF